MRAVRLEGFGPAENLKLVDVPIPEPRPDEVLIKVALAGIIFADIMIQRRDYVFEPPLPYSPGREVVGTVAKVGKNVTHLKEGDRVMALVTGGGYAEYALAPARNYELPWGAGVMRQGSVVPLPERASFSEGMFFHLNLPVAYSILHTYAKIPPGATLLIHGAAGSVGTCLTRLAKRNGNTVIALAGSEEKLAYCKANGADHGINHREADYAEEVLRITAGRGADVSLNSVCGTTLEADSKAVAPFGTILVYGRAAGESRVDTWPLLSKSQTLRTFTIYSYFGGEEWVRAIEFLTRWLETEPLEGVTRTFPLAEAPAAHRWIEERRSWGKIALAP